MTNSQMAAAISVGDTMQKIAGDYRFHGTVRSLFQKESGMWRVVLENQDGILHIFAPSQLQLLCKGKR